jgi:hypothetical protein
MVEGVGLGCSATRGFVAISFGVLGGTSRPSKDSNGHTLVPDRIGMVLLVR